MRNAADRRPSRNELENYEGIIQSDGLNAYKKVAARSNGKVTRLSCLQHCKRGFIDLQGNPDADFILEQVNLLYSLSCSCRLCGVDFFEYLTDVIDRIAAMGPKATEDTCRDLLPDRWKRSAGAGIFQKR